MTLTWWLGLYAVGYLVAFLTAPRWLAFDADHRRHWNWQDALFALGVSLVWGVIAGLWGICWFIKQVGRGLAYLQRRVSQ